MFYQLSSQVSWILAHFTLDIYLITLQPIFINWHFSGILNNFWMLAHWPYEAEIKNRNLQHYSKSAQNDTDLAEKIVKNGTVRILPQFFKYFPYLRSFFSSVWWSVKMITNCMKYCIHSGTSRCKTKSKFKVKCSTEILYFHLEKHRKINEFAAINLQQVTLSIENTLVYKFIDCNYHRTLSNIIEDYRSQFNLPFYQPLSSLGIGNFSTHFSQTNV